MQQSLVRSVPVQPITNTFLRLRTLPFLRYKTSAVIRIGAMENEGAQKINQLKNKL